MKFLAKFFAPALLALGFTVSAIAFAGANEVVCSEKICDEQQIGPYVAPDIPTPNTENRFDPRGKPIPVPVPGMDGVVVRHRPGAGVWLGSAPGSANVFLKPARERVSVDIKVDF